jgi:ABC-type sugar transport system permease subunit
MGMPELLIIAFFVVIPIAALIVVVFAVVDAAGRPASEFESIQQNRTLWIVLPIVLTVCTGIGGLIAGLIYLVSMKPKLNAVTAVAAH